MPILQRLLLITVLCAVLSCFELWKPVERDHPRKERVRNIAATLIFILLGGLVTRVTIASVSWPVPASEQHGLGSSLLVVFVSLFVTDLLFYWYHRAQHAFEWLWRIHELHHSDAHMNATTSLRTFWLESPIQALFISVPVSFISYRDVRAVVLVPIVATVWLFFAHANWRLHLKWLAAVFAGPQQHRIHHSIRPEHRGKNFAQFFPIIDVVFGTYAHPSANDFPPTGTPDLPTRVHADAMLVRPFKVWAGFGVNR